jgi:DNA-binding Lrp family transcriptional regulator
MAVTGCVLVRIQPGRDREVGERIRAIEGVKGVCLVTGRFDAIADVEAPDMDALTEVICGKIRRIDGVLYTETLVCAVCL